MICLLDKQTHVLANSIFPVKYLLVICWRLYRQISLINEIRTRFRIRKAKYIESEETRIREFKHFKIKMPLFFLSVSVSLSLILFLCLFFKIIGLLSSKAEFLFQKFYLPFAELLKLIILYNF